MTDALDNARDALEDALDAEVYQGPKVRAVFAALRAVLAEHERLTAPPTEDEREGLCKVIDDASDRWTLLDGNHAHRSRESRDECMQGRCDGDTTLNGYGFTSATPSPTRVEFTADALLTAGFRRQAPVTEAEILAGLNAELLPAHRAPDLSFYAQANIDRMRAALEAARGGDSMIDDVETRWSRELQADVSIQPSGSREYALYIDGSHELEGTLPSIEDFLNRLALFTDTDMRDGL